MTLTPDQLRATRAILGLSQTELADLCVVSTMTIKRAEGSSQPFPAEETVAAITKALEKRGVVFLAPGDKTDGGAGVRLKKSAAK